MRGQHGRDLRGGPIRCLPLERHRQLQKPPPGSRAQPDAALGPPRRTHRRGSPVSTGPRWPETRTGVPNGPGCVWAAMARTSRTRCLVLNASFRAPWIRAYRNRPTSLARTLRALSCSCCLLTLTASHPCGPPGAGRSGTAQPVTGPAPRASSGCHPQPTATQTGPAGASNRPPVSTAASRHGEHDPPRRRAIATERTPSISTTTATGSATGAGTVNSAANCAAAAARTTNTRSATETIRRNQSRTVEAGTSSNPAIGRCPDPPALASDAAPITVAASAPAQQHTGRQQHLRAPAPPAPPHLPRRWPASAGSPARYAADPSSRLGHPELAVATGQRGRRPGGDRHDPRTRSGSCGPLRPRRHPWTMAAFAQAFGARHQPLRLGQQLTIRTPQPIHEVSARLSIDPVLDPAEAGEQPKPESIGPHLVELAATDEEARRSRTPVKVARIPDPG